MPDISILQPAVAAVPTGFTIAGAQEIVLKGVTASFDGTGAAGAFVPAVQVVNPAGVIVGTYTLGQTLAAGALADVSWFPGVSSGGSGVSTGFLQVPVVLNTPDQSGNGFAASSLQAGFVNVNAVKPGFVPAATGTWEGTVVVPPDYASTPSVILSLVSANTTAAKACRFFVSSSVVPNGSVEDATYTNETAVNIVVPTTAFQRFDQSYTLSTSPGAGETLNLKVTRDGTNGGDTLTTQTVLLWTCMFQYLN